MDVDDKPTGMYSRRVLKGIAERPQPLINKTQSANRAVFPKTFPRVFR